LHFSLLPRWRGAAPVERAILAGDTETGVCVMQIERGLDTGPVYARAATPIGAGETAGELRARLVTIGTGLLVETVPRIGALAAEPQSGEPTHADKLTTEEFELDLGRPPEELLRRVRAGNPRPGAWTTVDGHRLKVWRARVVDGVFVPTEVQPEGRARMPYDAFVRGKRAASTQLGT
jgi:methionyl-tRNA formyltransferase